MEFLKKEDKQFISLIIKSFFVLVLILGVFFVVKIIGEAMNLKYVGAGIGPVATISFDGKGEVLAVPDIANISFSIKESGNTQKEVQNKVAKKSKATIDLLGKAGIAEKDIKTLNYNAYPQYDYGPQCLSYPCPPSKPPKIIGFEVNQSVGVKVRQTDEVGKILDILASANVTDISGPNFEIDEVEKVQAEARRKAIADAKNKAENLARDLGVKLVRVVNFSEGNQGGGPVYYDAKAMSISRAETSLLPEIPKGENKISSFVTITYEIK